MKFVVIGASRESFTSKKNGKRYRTISVAQKDINWIGTHGETMVLSEDNLNVADIETDNGEIFAADGKKYIVDIDYNNRGFIVGMRFYNE